MPITDEKAPKDSDFELLIRRLWTVPLDAALMFNCQMGRGRTTTGMIIATLVVLRRLGAFPTRVLASSGPQGGFGSVTAVNGSASAALMNGSANGVDVHAAGEVNGFAAGGSQGQQPHAAVPAWFVTKVLRGSSSGGMSSPTAASTPRGAEQKLKAGMYGVVRSLLRVLERGVVGKAILDAVVDACSAMQVGAELSCLQGVWTAHTWNRKSALPLHPLLPCCRPFCPGSLLVGHPFALCLWSQQCA